MIDTETLARRLAEAAAGSRPDDFAAAVRLLVWPEGPSLQGTARPTVVHAWVAAPWLSRHTDPVTVCDGRESVSRTVARDPPETFHVRVRAALRELGAVAVPTEHPDPRWLCRHFRDLYHRDGECALGLSPATLRDAEGRIPCLPAGVTIAPGATGGATTCPRVEMVAALARDGYRP